MKMPERKYIYIAAAALAVLIVGYFALFRAEAVRVETGLVSRGEVLLTIDAEGRTRYHDRYVVTAPVSGKMFRIQLQEGDRVPRGFVLTYIDPAPPRPIEPGRLPDTGIYPYAYKVFVPEDGILSKIFVSSEGMIQAGTPIAEIGKLAKIEIVADILSSDAIRVEPHMPVLVDNWGGDTSLKARVRNVEPKAFTKVSALGVEEQRVNVIADFDDPPERLGDDYKVDVRIVVWEGRDVLRVPSSALFRFDGDWCVYAVSGSRARLRKVEIGHRSPSFTHVTNGLGEGEAVILHPPNNVADGTRISAN